MNDTILSSIILFLSTAYFTIITYEIFNLRKDINSLTSKLLELAEKLSALQVETKDLRQDLNDLNKKVYELSEKVSKIEAKEV